MDEELAQNMARIYFDPKRGSEALGRIMPLLEDYARNRAATDALSGAGRYTVPRAAGMFDELSSAQLQGSPRQQAAQAPPPQERPQTRSTLEQPGQLPATSASGGTLGKDIEPVSYDPIDTLTTDLFSTTNDMAPMDTPPVSPEFVAKVHEISTDLGANPRDLIAVMRFETGGTFDPAEKNRAGSGATGLIQFMPSTAKDLTGADSKEAAIKIMESMSPVQQLDYVQKYLAPFKGKLNSLEDVYMAILYPKAVGKDPDFALFERGTKAYWQNRGLDLDKDGVITKDEAASKVRSFNATNGMVEA